MIIISFAVRLIQIDCTMSTLLFIDRGFSVDLIRVSGRRCGLLVCCRHGGIAKLEGMEAAGSWHATFESGGRRGNVNAIPSPVEYIIPACLDNYLFPQLHICFSLFFFFSPFHSIFFCRIYSHYIILIIIQK